MGYTTTKHHHQQQSKSTIISCRIINNIKTKKNDNNDDGIYNYLWRQYFIKKKLIINKNLLMKFLLLILIIFGYLTLLSYLVIILPSVNAVALDTTYSAGNYISKNVLVDNTVTASAYQQQQQSQPVNSGCPTSVDSDCMRCNIEGCIKCPIFLVQDTRSCVELCPSGYIDQWSSSPDFMGRICINQGLSAPLLAAITGLVAGFFVCFTLLIVAIILIKRKRRRKTIKKKLINENTMDRNDFLRQLDEMRPNSEYFLAMLNDTRRQIRKLYLSGENTAANSYRPIVRDLAKILILLNRPIELIPTPPHDWNRIYNWSEQALDRYKPKIGQLIDFFQGPSLMDHNNHLNTTTNNDIDYHMNFSNGDPRRNFSPHNQQKIQLFGSLISLHEFDEPRSSDPFGSSFNTLKGNLISDLNTSSLWLEDEFFKLGFRPQDEITTEL